MVGFVYRKEGESEMEFYLRKNRSRPLNTWVYAPKTKGWKLIEDEIWLPQNLKLSDK